MERWLPRHHMTAERLNALILKLVVVLMPTLLVAKWMLTKADEMADRGLFALEMLLGPGSVLVGVVGGALCILLWVYLAVAVLS